MSVCPSSEQKVWLNNFIFMYSAVTCVLFFQDPKNKRFTLCDEQLQQVFGMYVNLGLWQIVNNCTWYMWLLFLLNSLSMVERCQMRWNSSSKRHGQNKNQNTVNFAPYSWQQMQVFFSTDRANWGPNDHWVLLRNFSILWRRKKKDDKKTKAFYDWATTGIPVIMHDCL